MAVPLVLTFDDGPRGLGSGRLAQHLFPKRTQLLIRAHSAIIELERLVNAGRFLERLQTLVQSVFRQVDPEFEQHEAFVEQHPLVGARLLQINLECRLVELAREPRRHNFGVPGIQKDADTALRRQCAPVTPRRRSRQLFARTRPECMDANVPWIHPFGELVCRLAAPPAFDAADDEQHRPLLGLRQVVLRVQQRFPQARLLPRVNGLRDHVSDFSGFEHRRGLA